MHDVQENVDLSHDLRSKKDAPIPSYSLLRRRCFIFSGFLSITLGVLGIVLPILPTTPFMLLGAYCFARSSEKWHHWLLNHPVFGEYIVAFRDRRGLTLKQKYRIALSVTVMMSISVFFDFASRMSMVMGLIWGICMIVLVLSPTASEVIDLKGSSKPAGGAL